MHMRRGIREEHDANHSGPAGDWAAGRGRHGGERACGWWRQAEGGRDPRMGEPLGLTGTWAQVEDGKGGGNRTREGSHRLAQKTPWTAQHGRKAQTSGGGRQAGAPSRWTVAPRPGEMGGGEAGAKRERICTDR